MVKISQVVLVFFLGLFALPAIARVPAVNLLLDKLTQVRGKQTVGRVQINLRCQSAGTADSHEERLFIKAPSMVRRERAPDVVEICRAEKCWQRRGTATAVALSEWTYLQYLFVAEKPSRERYESVLTGLKVNMKETTLARFHGRVAYVIGAKEWERDRPQLWIDKDSFLPLRLFVPDGRSLVDIGWFGWNGRLGGDHFPSEIEISRDGKIFEHCESIDINTTTKISDDLFKL